MDFEKSTIAFEKFLQEYDTNDEKIKLKEIHTYGVVEAATAIAKELKLNAEDTYLAKLIALLHDIGRFEQARRFNSFVDKDTIDHAEFGADILFKDGRIREFIETNEYDDLIENAIRIHNKYEIPLGLTDHTHFHCKIIRDADKLDIFRVMAVDSMTAFANVEESIMNQENITDDVYNDFLNHKPILSAKRKTHLDLWVSCLAFIFDFNFSISLKIVQKRNYIDILINRIQSQNLKTRTRLEEIRKIAHAYISAN